MGPEGHSSQADPSLCPGCLLASSLSSLPSMHQVFTEHLLRAGNWDRAVSKIEKICTPGGQPAGGVHRLGVTRRQVGSL